MTSLRPDGLIEFHFYRPNVSSVSIAGDFNGWRPDEVAMHPIGEGWWAAALRITPGEYRFRYSADGEWFADYAANGVEMNRKHGWTSILTVPAPAETITLEQEQEQPLRIAA